MGGVGNVAGNVIRGDIDSFQDVIASFGVGTIAGGDCICRWNRS